MKTKNHGNLYFSITMFLAFIAWSIAICYVDVAPLGPQASFVGFASINCYVHQLTGVHLSLYRLTDLLSLVPAAFIFCFALVGIFQWCKRKKIKNVDYAVLLLGGFYIAVISVYIFFEFFIVNYRPILINGRLEASYPSSTTMLIICVMSTSALQLKYRIKKKFLNKLCVIFITVFTIFMVISRLVSGVHWFTDIIGGIFISLSLSSFYRFLFLKQKQTLNKIY